MGIAPGDAVLVIEHRGEQQIVYNALVAGISMRGELVGPKGEPAIEATFVTERGGLDFMRDMDPWHPTLSVPQVVHISHRDWIERRASLGYEELPGPTPGVCRYCRCTERRACRLADGRSCGWLFVEATVCSNPECEEQFVQDNLLRTAGRAV
jgi:hypothetical protein